MWLLLSAARATHRELLAQVEDAHARKGAAAGSTGRGRGGGQVRAEPRQAPLTCRKGRRKRDHLAAPVLASVAAGRATRRVHQ